MGVKYGSFPAKTGYLTGYEGGQLSGVRWPPRCNVTVQRRTARTDQHYTWTAVLLPNSNRLTSPRLVLRRVPAPDHSRCPPSTCCPHTLSSSASSSPANPSPIIDTSPSTSSSSSHCPSPSSSTSSSTSSQCSQGSSPCSACSQCHSEPEDEHWTCQLVEGQPKIVLRRQLRVSTPLNAEKPRQFCEVYPPLFPHSSTLIPIRKQEKNTHCIIEEQNIAAGDTKELLDIWRATLH